MEIKVGDIIKVEYVGTFEDGTIFDSTEMNGNRPLKFEVGAGQIIPGFDKSVIGKAVGEEYEIKLQPSETYGEYREGSTRAIPKDNFPQDQEPKEGMMIIVMGPNNQPIPATIEKIEDDKCTIDLNHPMAGKILNFKIKILETECEPDPPHVCGCGADHDHEHKH